ncbi:alpha/beta hydrolase [Hydrocarboniphaga sp.]|uniref:alpha/beta hydrolase n=1 Tax=Hydrocarboniphaga sp. TaxID=2033016 RepID=UPI003D0C791F
MQSPQVQTPSRFEAVKTTFVCGGVTCAATLRLPESRDGKPLPAILMVHGWGGVQNALTPPFYDRFTGAGFAVMTFDYRGWGDSAGMPRNQINPKQRVLDADAALAHLKSLPQIDADRIVLWGSSFGGGHVVELAAEHPELLGAIAQVPMLNGMAAVRAVPLFTLLRFALYALADLLKPGRPIYLPVVSAPGEFGSMDRDDAQRALFAGMAAIGRPYDNRVAARSLMTMGPYRPFKRLKDIRVPTLIVGGTRDSVAPFNEADIVAAGNDRIRVRSIDANHFEPYFEPTFSTSIAHQLSFLASL